jgi:hypothetical protein
VALLRDKSVSVVTVGVAPTPTGDPPVRIYIFGNDGITLSREPPAVVSEGEIVVASSEELHAAALKALVQLLSRPFQDDRYPLSPRIVALKEILGQLRPEPERQAAAGAVASRALRPRAHSANAPTRSHRGRFRRPVQSA